MEVLRRTRGWLGQRGDLVLCVCVGRHDPKDEPGPYPRSLDEVSIPVPVSVDGGLESSRPNLGRRILLCIGQGFRESEVKGCKRKYGLKHGPCHPPVSRYSCMPTLTFVHDPQFIHFV